MDCRPERMLSGGGGCGVRERRGERKKDETEKERKTSKVSLSFLSFPVCSPVQHPHRLRVGLGLDPPPVGRGGVVGSCLVDLRQVDPFLEQRALLRGRRARGRVRRGHLLLWERFWCFFVRGFSINGSSSRRTRPRRRSTRRTRGRSRRKNKEEEQEEKKKMKKTDSYLIVQVHLLHHVLGVARVPLQERRERGKVAPVLRLAVFLHRLPRR